MHCEKYVKVQVFKWKECHDQEWYWHVGVAPGPSLKLTLFCDMVEKLEKYSHGRSYPFKHVFNIVKESDLTQTMISLNLSSISVP